MTETEQEPGSQQGTPAGASTTPGCSSQQPACRTWIGSKMDSKVDLKVTDCLDTFGKCNLGADMAQPICLLQHLVC